MRTSFQQQLAEVEQLIVETSGLVLQQLDRTIRTMETRDVAMAEVVISGDDGVDERYIDVEKKVLTLLATQAPVASDLRLVSAILHINIHLERMADLCVNIAKFLIHTPRGPHSEEIVTEIMEMGRQAGKMLETAIKSFSDRDLEAALSLPRMDDTVDRLNRRLFKQVASEFSGSEDEVAWGSRMVLISRQLERMGDHTVDIAEQVAFMITGEFREFTDASHD